MDWKKEMTLAMLSIQSAYMKNGSWNECHNCPFDDYCTSLEHNGFHTPMSGKLKLRIKNPQFFFMRGGPGKSTILRPVIAPLAPGPRPRSPTPDLYAIFFQNLGQYGRVPWIPETGIWTAGPD